MVDRIVAATHRSLSEKVRRGEFREDLYCGFQLALSSLACL